MGGNQFWGLGCCALALVTTCGGDDDRFQSIDPAQEAKTKKPSNSKSPEVDKRLVDAGVSDAGAPDASVMLATQADSGEPSKEQQAPAFFAKNCGDDIICAGTKACVEDAEAGGAYCACDVGFTRKELEDDEFECVLDTECIELKPVFESCTHAVAGQPLATSFYSVEYCAGVPVPKKALGEFTKVFEVLQDGKLPDPDETYVKLVERDVESIVTLALDVSGSILEAENKGAVLTPLVARLRGFVEELEKVPGPPVVVTMLVFGRSVKEYIPATTNLAEVDRALKALETKKGQDAVKNLVKTNGTELYEAVKSGVQATERLQTMRRQVSQSSVLTAGTVVIITDGEDKSGGVFDPNLLAETTVSVVSVGINEDINDLELTAIGKSGSFLAPNPEDWGAALDEIADRIQARSGSIYGTLFCSAATTMDHVVRTQYRGAGEGSSVSCSFNASNFGKDQTQTCESFVNGFCEARLSPDDGKRRCGGILRCGSECEPGECCNDRGNCVAPSPEPDCSAQNSLCRPGGGVCAAVPDTTPTEYACTMPTPLNEDCSEVPCEDGVAYCDPMTKTCLPSREEDEACESAAECISLNCAERGPGLAGSECKPSARMFDVCSGEATAVCELGAHCQSICVAQNLWSCSSDSECLGGKCNTEIQRCEFAESCHFAWDDKVEF